MIMNDRLLTNILIFILTFLINIFLIGTILAGWGLIWKIIILTVLDTLIWFLADLLEIT
jgi:hypothetical protein